MTDFVIHKHHHQARSKTKNAKLSWHTVALHLWRDQSGFLLSVEMLLLATVVVIGLIVGHAAMRDALNSELSDVGGALQDLNQSYSYQLENSDGSITEASFVDSLDFCDDPGDPIGAADNCVVFNLTPTDEA